MKWIIPLLLGICGAHAVSHSLQYFYTGTTGMADFPQFIAVGIVDGEQIDYYDSVSGKNVLKQVWMEGVRDEKMITNVRKGIQDTFRANVPIAMLRFNQAAGVHTFQMMCGCEWDEETGPTGGSWQFGYDGEDFLTLDLKELTWIAPVQQAFITKQKWEQNRADLEYRKNYLTQECIDWLKKYVDYGKNTLKRTVSPTMSLLQKSPSSPVTCHATGFYPSRVMVFWRRDGEQVYEDVEHGEVLHNEDGTFQKSVDLTVKPQDLDSGRYDCVVQLPGIQEDVVTRLERSVVKTNHGNTGRTIPGSDVPTGAIIGGVVVLLLLVAIIISGVLIWKKKKGDKKGFAPTDTSVDGSNSSNSSGSLSNQSQENKTRMKKNGGKKTHGCLKTRANTIITVQPRLLPPPDESGRPLTAGYGV